MSIFIFKKKSEIFYQIILYLIIDFTEIIKGKINNDIKRNSYTKSQIELKTKIPSIYYFRDMALVI